jgi:S-adenosylmethionine:tRNA ribosyltransferase-isomerase
MRLSDFDYILPKELIAQVPVEPRDHSRMMVLHRDTLQIEHRHYFDLPEYLGENDVLVFNQSKVIPARIRFTFREKEREIFFIREIAARSDGTPMRWEIMVRPGKFFQVGDLVRIHDDVEIEVEQVMPESEHGHRVAVIRDAKMRDTFQLLQDLGSIPLPPYIESTEGVDKYQNVYAETPGSVAAPTAGFHFTEELLERLRAKGVQTEFVTLHVGPGTFLPVMTDDVLKHVMHEEHFTLPAEVAERLVAAKAAEKRIVSVGTTTTRVLEYCARDGALVGQHGSTKLFIYPGFEWKFVDALITNFHLPKSTLLMLVSSFAGKEFALEAYRQAVAERYRFFSFGDGMLIL